MTEKNYLEILKRTARETLAEPRVKRFIAKSFEPGFEFPFDQTLTDLDRIMREYAENWSAVAAKHEAHGLYRQIAEFANIGEGVYVDLGCGAGNLLCALPKSARLIGVDINPYILQLAEQNLVQAKRKVSIYPDVRIGFLPSKGLVVRPEPILTDLDFRKVNLITDDVLDLGNTLRALYNQGIKADGAFYTLAGGHTVHRNAEVFSAMKFIQTGVDPNGVKSLEDILMPILKNAHFVVKKNGRFYLAIRGLSLNDNLETTTLSLNDYVAKNHAESLEVVKETTVSMMDERKENGIGLSHHVEGDVEAPQEVEEKARALPYELNLCELRVK